MLLLHSVKSFILLNHHEVNNIVQILSKGKRMKDMTIGAYCITHTPAYDWLLSCLGQHLSADDMEQLIVQASEIRNK